MFGWSLLVPVQLSMVQYIQAASRGLSSRCVPSKDLARAVGYPKNSMIIKLYLLWAMLGDEEADHE